MIHNHHVPNYIDHIDRLGRRMRWPARPCNQPPPIHFVVFRLRRSTLQWPGWMNKTATANFDPFRRIGVHDSCLILSCWTVSEPEFWSLSSSISTNHILIILLKASTEMSARLGNLARPCLFCGWAALSVLGWRHFLDDLRTLPKSFW